MSVASIILNDNWFYKSSPHILDHMDVDLLWPTTRWIPRCPTGYYRPQHLAVFDLDYGSTITADKTKFQIDLDVQQFEPIEITVKVNGKNDITVEGKHEEKQDKHGYVSRHFVRRYILPDDYDIKKVASNISSDGVLTIIAPPSKRIKDAYRTIPIRQTGTPAKVVKQKSKL